MAGNQITVIFSCTKCGLAYRATQQRPPQHAAGRFDCGDCGEPVHAWSGTHSYTGWEGFTPARQ
jgi:hypothetical protein